MLVKRCSSRELSNTKDDSSAAKLFCPVRGQSNSSDDSISTCQACATVVAQDWDEHGYKLFGHSPSMGQRLAF